MKYMLYSFRPRQWSKNLFLFLPLVFGKKLFSFPENAETALGFVIFCLMTSAVYLINDVLDLDRDRRHRIKRLRPIASGKVGTREALLLAAVLVTATLWLAFDLKESFGWTLAAYCALNLVYTHWFKNAVILDVFCLGVFFLLRIVAGTILANVEFSHWMIFMVILLALFLGFNKRRQELLMLDKHGLAQRPVLASYTLHFIDQIITVLISTLVIVYMLYTIDARTYQQFGTRHLYYSIPFVYYGIFRYLFLVHKRKSGEDPTGILFSDTMTQINLALWLLVCISVIYFRF